jgi:hypothetical protein
MKKLSFAFIVFILANQSIFAQDSVLLVKEIDSLYREDQIYLGVTYNILTNKARNMAQNGFSGGVHLGFLRDFPLNDKRNVAVGIGLGLATSSFNQNLKIVKTEGQFEYDVLDSGEFDKNKFDFYQLELPFEFRWRTSTAETYKFWRIYTGFKLGYVLSSRAKYIDADESYTYSINEIINRTQYGLTLSVGYDSWNLHLYYALNTIFKESKLNNEALNIKVIKVGLMFYIL